MAVNQGSIGASPSRSIGYNITKISQQDHYATHYDAVLNWREMRMRISLYIRKISSHGGKRNTTRHKTNANYENLVSNAVKIE